MLALSCCSLGSHSSHSLTAVFFVWWEIYHSCILWWIRFYHCVYVSYLDQLTEFNFDVKINLNHPQNQEPIMNQGIDINFVMGQYLIQHIELNFV